MESKTTPKKRIRPGVKALIVNDSKILMIKEKVKDRIIFDFPGGGMEYGEGFEETLHREVYEEVGLKVTVKKLIGNWQFINSWDVQIVCFGYQCSVEGESQVDLTKNVSDEQIFDTVWLTREEILANSDTYTRAKGMKEAVENLDL